MAYEQRVNNGTLFPNKSKQKPTSPDYSGSVLLDLSHFKVENNQINVRLAGWKKQGAKGMFLSLAASAPMERQQEAVAEAPQSLADLEDDLPF
jgi:hypothetical protein